MDEIRVLEDGLKQLNIYLSEDQKNQFKNYCSILLEKNKIMNLTSITDEKEIMIKHFLDSVLICKAMNMNEVKNMIDVGTGAGFPGIPIKILFPEIEVTLLDSLEKRIGFLEEVVKALNLEGVELIHGRAEDFGQNDEYREKFDLCTSRAVADLKVLSEYCLPFVKVGGIFVSFKSSQADKEIVDSKAAIEILGGKIDGNIIETLPLTDIKRSFIIIKKRKNTDNKYPRKAGKPAKKPLY